MQVQAQTQYRNHDCRQQGQRFTQAGNPRRGHAFGICQQFAGGFGAPGFKLLRAQDPFLKLLLQLGQAFLIQRNIERGTVFLTLGTAPAQYRNQ